MKTISAYSTSSACYGLGTMHDLVFQILHKFITVFFIITHHCHQCAFFDECAFHFDRSSCSITIDPYFNHTLNLCFVSLVLLVNGCWIHGGFLLAICDASHNIQKNHEGLTILWPLLATPCTLNRCLKQRQQPKKYAVQLSIYQKPIGKRFMMWETEGGYERWQGNA